MLNNDLFQYLQQQLIDAPPSSLMDSLRVQK
jgi:hypothetical protein